MRSVPLLIWLMCLTLNTACVRYSVTIDAIAIPTAADYRSYILLSGSDEFGDKDLHFRENAAIVDTALQMQGFTKAASVDEADLAIFLSFGISDPTTTAYTYSVPIYGQIGGGTTYHSGYIYGRTGSAWYSGTSHQTPRFGVVGSTTGTRYVTFYHRFVRLDAVDLRQYYETEQYMPVWKTTVLSTGSSGDLRSVFPYLIVASMDYFGTNTGKAVKITVRDGDPRVRRLALGERESTEP